MLEADPSEDTEASLRLLSRSAEVVRHYTQRYLNPDMDYYLKKITFVCWPPSEGEGCNKAVRSPVETPSLQCPDLFIFVKVRTFERASFTPQKLFYCENSLYTPKLLSL